MRQETRRRIDRYWADFFPRVPAGPAAAVVSHRSTLEGFEGLYALMRDGRALVSAPPAMVTEVRAWGVDATKVMDSAWWRRRAPEGTVLGPSTHAFLDAAEAVPPSHQSRQVAALEVVDALRGRVSHAEWVESGFDGGDVRKAWLVQDAGGRPVAAAGLTLFDGVPVDVGVVVAADARGRGYGKRVVAAAVRDAIHQHGFARWRSLETNQPSRRLATSLGFQVDCRQLAVRL